MVAAGGLPAGSDAERLKRHMALEQAIKGALAAPFRVAEASVGVLELLDELSEIGEPRALSDLGVGAQMGLAAVHGAAYLIVANLMPGG